MRATTLMELMVVIIIIGVLSTLGATHYGAYRENTLNREAQSNLGIIIGAERIARLERGNFIVCNNTANVNNNLRLVLSTAGNANWNYSTTVGGASAVCAQAVRNGGDARRFSLRDTNAAPVAGGCP